MKRQVKTFILLALLSMTPFLLIGGLATVYNVTHDGTNMRVGSKFTVEVATGNIETGGILGISTEVTLTQDISGNAVITDGVTGAVTLSKIYRSGGTDVAVADGGTGSSTGDMLVKGWVQFDGTDTITISDSYNVSSIGDNGVGNYTVYWDTDFSDDNFCAVASQGSYDGGCTVGGGGAGAYTEIETFNASAVKADVPRIHVIAIGDQ